ncbi:MAG: DHA1 family bicyclomycin/chloramphenicol resistance-like MFS transporter [Gammaproteobacteria bacterium]|jgi:DHA1 family bicyclomycin/chloramphenicol resistance-like MFS transporter
MSTQAPAPTNALALEPNLVSASLIVLLALIFGLAAFGTDMYLPAFPAIQRDFGATPQAVQLSLSIFLYGNAIGHLVLGPLSDRFGRKPVLLGGLFVFALASFGCAASVSITELFAYRLAQGGASAAGPVLVRALINDRVARDQAAQMLALLTGLMAFAAMLTPTLGGWIVQHGRWNTIFYSIGAMALALLVTAIFKVPETLPTERRLSRLGAREVASGYIEIGRNLKFWSYVLPPALMFAGVFAYAVVNSFLLINDLGMAEDFYGISYSLAACAYVAGSLAGRYLVGLLGIHRTIVCGLTIGLCAAVGSVVASLTLPISTALVVVPGLCMFFSTSLMLPIASSVAVSLFPMRAGSASAVAGFTQISFAGFSSAIAAYLYDSTTLPLHAFTLGCCFAAVAIWVTSSRLRR